MSNILTAGIVYQFTLPRTTEQPSQEFDSSLRTECVSSVQLPMLLFPKKPSFQRGHLYAMHGGHAVPEGRQHDSLTLGMPKQTELGSAGCQPPSGSHSLDRLQTHTHTHMSQRDSS